MFLALPCLLCDDSLSTGCSGEIRSSKSQNLHVIFREPVVRPILRGESLPYLILAADIEGYLPDDALTVLSFLSLSLFAHREDQERSPSRSTR
jgi:hypothetical protein